MIVTARTDYTVAGRSPAAANTETSWTTVFEGSNGYPFFPGVMYVNRLELGDIPATGPLRQHYLPGLAVERFSDNRRPLHLGLDHRFSRRLTVWHFTHGPQSLPLGHWHLLCRTVSQRAADRAVLYRYLVVPEFLPENIGMWFKSELDPNIQFFVSSMLCLGLFTAARVCEQVRAAIQSLPRAGRRTPVWRWA